MMEWKRLDGKNLYYDGELTRQFVLPKTKFTTIESYIKILELKEKKFNEDVLTYEFQKLMEKLKEV